MEIVVTVHCSPYANDSVRSAIEFCRAVLDSEHTLKQVFFFQEGVYNASANTDIPTDEFQAFVQWQELAREYDVSLLVCVTAAEKRGIHPIVENKEFTIGGLAEFAMISSQADRVVQFK